ncbi:MAG: MFS transporter [Methanosarcinales archaeon]|nr:MFS transporter [Methanosarcinales archaeon]
MEGQENDQAEGENGGQRPGKNIVLLGLVSLLNDISSEIIQPILPLFITSLGGGSLAVGLIGGFSDGLPSILKVFSGYWSDRLGQRKPLVVMGYGVSAFSKLFLPFATLWQHVFLLKTLERCGKGIRSAPRDAMISESAEKEVRGRGFGLHRSMDTFGAVAGSLLAYLLWQGGLSFQAIFLIAGVFAVVALAPFVLVRESFKSPQARMGLALSGLSPELRKFISVACLFAAGNFSYMFFILRAQEFFSGAMKIGAPLLLYVLFNLVYALLAFPVGAWSDRLGRKKVLTLGYALYALVALGFAAATSWAWMVLLFMLYGLVYALVDGSERAFVSDLSCASVRCTSLGIYYGAVGFAAIFSGLAAGALWARFSPGAAFLFGSALAALAAAALWRMKPVQEIM